jgi:hypothetical protein
VRAHEKGSIRLMAGQDFLSKEGVDGSEEGEFEEGDGEES